MDKGGIFYKVPKSMLSIFAVRDRKELKKAALAWKAETLGVEGQEQERLWGIWVHPWQCPVPACSLRG
jgi:hypothetical protein